MAVHHLQPEETCTWTFKGYLREGTKSEKSYSSMQLELGKQSLRYWKRQKNKEPVCLDLLLVWVEDTVNEEGDKEHKRTTSCAFQILGPEQVIKVVAASEEQKESWMYTLRDLVFKNLLSESKYSCKNLQ